MDKIDANKLFDSLPMQVKTTLLKYQGNVYVGGGYLRDSILGEKVKDIDLFSTYGVQTQVREYLKSISDSYFTSNNATTFYIKGQPTFQLITKWTYQDAQDMIKDFDFTINQIGLYVKDNKPIVVYLDEFLEDIASKTLTYTQPIREENCAGSLLRMVKFLGRGYTIDRKNLAALIGRAVSALPNVSMEDDDALTTYHPDFHSECDYTNRIYTLLESNKCSGGY